MTNAGQVTAIRLSLELRKAIRDAAREKRLSASDYIREAVTVALKADGHAIAA